MIFGNQYRGKRVLITGHTSFKGSWLSLWLDELGAEVHGLSLAPEDTPSMNEIVPGSLYASRRVQDIRDFGGVKDAVREIEPEIVFHMAAQAIVRRSYEDPLETFGSNATGTAHVLEAIRVTRTKCATVVVTSDKCYENREWVHAYRETDPLGGHDVYSMSKAASELVARSWNRSFFDKDPGLGPIVTVRAGNVIGGGDYAVDRIVPDCIRALAEGRPIQVRNPHAVRPWQHVLECLSGYLALGARLMAEGKQSAVATSFNFGPNRSAQRSVRRLVEEVLEWWPGEWVDGSVPGEVHEAKLLSLSIDKAAMLLGWRPVWNFSEGVRETVEWYHLRHHLAADAERMEEFSRLQIRRYVERAGDAGVEWAGEDKGSCIN